MKTISGGQKKVAKSILGSNPFRKVDQEKILFSACTLVLMLNEIFFVFDINTNISRSQESIYFKSSREPNFFFVFDEKHKIQKTSFSYSLYYDFDIVNKDLIIDERRRNRMIYIELIRKNIDLKLLLAPIRSYLFPS